MRFDPFSSVQRSTAVRRFIAQVAAVLGVFTTAVVVGIYLRTEHIVMDGVRQEADSYLGLVVTMRAWNAQHGGVYVLKDEDSPTNSYLRRLGVEPDTTTVAATALTLRNPSAMTKELSVLTETGDGVSFTLTSLEPVNPANRPDAWEADQLRAFEDDARPAETIVSDGAERAYRRMIPLVTTEACLPCHGAQGYETGEIRGALSVEVPLAKRDAQLRANAVGLTALWVALMVGLGVSVYLLVYRMAVRIERSESRLEHLAATDALTGLPNRRTAFERLHEEIARASRESSGVGVIMIDIDHFKRVNDEHGHAAGDRVLVAVAGAMQDSLREYDFVGRIGGEEFIVIAPQVDSDALHALAERIRTAVESCVLVHEGDTDIRVTVSAGCSLAQGDVITSETLMKAADEALYEAKARGRNRVVSAGRA